MIFKKVTKSPKCPWIFLNRPMFIVLGSNSYPGFMHLKFFPSGLEIESKNFKKPCKNERRKDYFEIKASCSVVGPPIIILFCFDQGREIQTQEARMIFGVKDNENWKIQEKQKDLSRISYL